MIDFFKNPEHWANISEILIAEIFLIILGFICIGLKRFYNRHKQSVPKIVRAAWQIFYHATLVSSTYMVWRALHAHNNIGLNWSVFGVVLVGRSFGTWLDVQQRRMQRQIIKLEEIKNSMEKGEGTALKELIFYAVKEASVPYTIIEKPCLLIFSRMTIELLVDIGALWLVLYWIISYH